MADHSRAEIVRRIATMGRLQLAGADLAGLDMDGLTLVGAELSYADLTGTRLDRADLTGAWLDAMQRALAISAPPLRYPAPRDGATTCVLHQAQLG